MNKKVNNFDAGNPLANKEVEFVSRFWVSNEVEKEYIESFFFNEPETSRIIDLIGDDWEFYKKYKSQNLKRISIIANLALSTIPVGSNVLDLGCSCGQVGYNIEKAGDYNVTGIDLNERSLKLGKIVLQNLSSNMTLIHGNALSIPVKKNYFDAVIACDVIEHIPNHKLLLKEIYRILKPGGTFFMDTDNERRVKVGVLFRRLQHLLKGRNPLKWKHAWANTDGGHSALTTPKSIAKVAKQVGFDKINIKYWGEPIPVCKKLLSTNFILTAKKKI